MTKPNNSPDDLAGLVGQYVSVLLQLGAHRSVVKGLLVRTSPQTLTLRSLASSTRGRETLVLRQCVVCVQRVEQPQAEAGP